MKPAIIHADAEAELRAAVAYYEDKSPGLGLDLEAKVRIGIGEIEQRPEGFPFHRLPPIRQHHIARFPYTAYYVVRPETVWILAIAHRKQRPDYWRGRLTGK